MAELRVVRHTTHFMEGCRFYGETLGWPVTKQWDAPNAGRIFGYGDTARVELIDNDTDEAVAGVSLAIEVADATHVNATMQIHAVEITQDLADQPWGHRNFSVLDPTGMTVTFFQVIV